MKVVEVKKEQELDPIKYPCIMQLKYETYETNRQSLVVLFDQHECGSVLICSSGNFAVGSYHTDWCEHNFERYTGEITLSND